MKQPRGRCAQAEEQTEQIALHAIKVFHRGLFGMVRPGQRAQDFVFDGDARDRRQRRRGDGGLRIDVRVERSIGGHASVIGVVRRADIL